jgi:branched-chain amino acid transport system substrate-binding protein
VRNALEQTRGLVDTAGTVNMSATDHLGVDGAGFRMIEAAGGKWKLVP